MFLKNWWRNVRKWLRSLTVCSDRPSLFKTFLATRRSVNSYRAQGTLSNWSITSHRITVGHKPAFFLATFRILTGFGNAGNWVFCLSSTKILELSQNLLSLQGKSWISTVNLGDEFEFCQFQVNLLTFLSDFTEKLIFRLEFEFFPWVFEFFEFFLAGGQQKRLV